MNDDGAFLGIIALVGVFFLGIVCGNEWATVNQEKIDWAQTVCAENGGIEYVTVDSVTCNNGAEFKE